MTSIFSDKFIENIDRINARSQRVREQSGGSEGFARVLADVERDAKNVNSDGELSSTTGALKDGLLSNLSSRNQPPKEVDVHARARMITAPTLVLEQPAPVKAAPPLQPQTVKSALEPVKTTPPQAAPAAPVVISARRMSPSPLVQAAGGKTALPVAPERIKNLVITAGRFHGIDPALSLAVASAESAFSANAVSKDGHASKGIFQLVDATGKEQHELSGLSDQYDPFDPGMNAHLGVGYLRRLVEMFSSETKLTSNLSTIPAKSADELEKLAVAAFNAGQGRVARAQAKAQSLGQDPTLFENVAKHLPPSTREYVEKVVQTKAAFADQVSAFARV